MVSLPIHLHGKIKGFLKNNVLCSTKAPLKQSLHSSLTFIESLTIVRSN